MADKRGGRRSGKPGGAVGKTNRSDLISALPPSTSYGQNAALEASMAQVPVAAAPIQAAPDPAGGPAVQPVPDAAPSPAPVALGDALAGHPPMPSFNATTDRPMEHILTPPTQGPQTWQTAQDVLSTVAQTSPDAAYLLAALQSKGQ